MFTQNIETLQRAIYLVTTCFLVTGCSVDLDERIVECPGAESVESLHSFGYMIAIRPTDGYHWEMLMREPFREYGRRPITFEKLESQFGTPLRTWEKDGRPFAEYETSLGVLRLGLEEDRSGSSAFRIWRLRWLAQSNTSLSHILEESVAACVEDLLRPDVTVAVLDRKPRYPRIFIEFTGLQIREVIWPRSNTRRNE